ncbi:MAG: hypothetical protein LQ338_004411 [Usnochroma carphineum]|nr:MAG: hypothetical protein LQ338_004411 [Usnochroma carphineum]
MRRDLKNRPKFIRPFIIACSTRNPKCAGSGINCLLRLVASKGLSSDSLKDVLDAFRECASLAALDVQLKVLQALPLLLQNYAAELSGRLWISALQVCFLLQGSKTAVVSNTAAASLQQFIAFTFERIAKPDDSASLEEPSQSVPTQDGSIPVSGAAADAYHLLDDICLLSEGKEPNILHGARLIPSSGLELVESILANHIDIVAMHESLIYVCRTRLMPLIIKVLSEKASFSLTVRAVRLLRLLTYNLLPAMNVELELALNHLNSVLDPVASPVWKRALCLEFFRDIHEDPTLIRKMYGQYDDKKERKSIIGDHLSLLVRIAAEKPETIGLGQQLSQIEAQQSLAGEPIAIESGDIAGAITTSANETRFHGIGLSSQWSTVRWPCIDQVDRSQPPELPETYIHSLVLVCINSFSEGLAKFLLPLTDPSDSKPRRKRRTTSYKNGQGDSTLDDDMSGQDTRTSIQSSSETSQPEARRPINPLTLEDHEMYDQICTTASMVDRCWPAILATSSTFLNASLDSEYLHALIRAFQKFIQVAGLLDLSTPRDAFLTTLAKHAVPVPSVDSLKTLVLEARESSEGDTDNDHDDSERNRSPSPGSPSQRSRNILASTSITARNLLCLRALLNLGIALGPVLGDSWTIVLETLHQVDLALMASQSQSMKSRRHVSHGASTHSSNHADFDDEELYTEKNAVDTAVSRLFQSTGDLPDQAFLHILECLCSLTFAASRLPKHDNKKTHLSKPLSPSARRPQHIRFPSASGLNMNKSMAAKDCMLLLDRVAHLARCNSSRLIQMRTSATGWSALIMLFIDHLRSVSVVPEVRISAASKLNELINRMASAIKDASTEQQDNLASRCLDALATEVSSLWKSNDTRSAGQCSSEIHAMGLETLTSVLEQLGEIITSGWDSVFSVVNSIFETNGQPLAEGIKGPEGKSRPRLKSSRLIRPSFVSLQLLCSDFLMSIPSEHFSTLLDTQYYFASQDQEFNISLTSISLFRTTSDFLLRSRTKSDQSMVEELVTECETETQLVEMTTEKDDSISRSALWVCILVHLARLIMNSRPEVRHSALHTLFGIIDASGNSLSAKAWTMCFRLVFFRLLSAMALMHKEGHTENSQDSSWDDTAVLLIQTLSKTFIQAYEAWSGHPSLPLLWDQLLSQYAELLGRQRLGLARVVFSSLEEILLVVKKAPNTHRLPIDSARALWRNNNPSTYQLHGATGNHEALAAYLQYIRRLHGLLDTGYDTAQAEIVMANLRLCIKQSTAVVYGSDVDDTTNVQKLVLENLALVPTSSLDTLIKLVDELAYLVTLAFRAEGDRVQKGKSFVALSKAAMDALERLVKQHCARTEVPTAVLVSTSLRALNTPIHLKYKWQHEGRGTPTWKKATSTTLSILDTNLLRNCGGTATDQERIWAAIVEISDGIAAADTDACESKAQLPTDQAFDIESFSQLANIVIPVLGSPSVPDTIRRKYVESLFEHSLIHEPHPDDLARPDQDLLDGLRNRHIGRVQDLPPKLRSKMSYLLLDHIFDLVAVHDGSIERVKLAQAAAPYLILRAGLVLKAYVCDQPLRGRLPQPLSQKREMHYVLRKLIDLDSEPKAFPQTTMGGEGSGCRKHLFLLFGLVTRALKVAGRDEEMSGELQRVLEVVGEEFGGF